MTQEQAVLGPDSLMWKYFGDARVLFLLPSTTTVQVAHPGIGAGVEEHSAYKEDPWGRAERSLALLWPVLYNTEEGVRDFGTRLREMHRDIKGTDFNGKKYHALNPELYTWVHITTYYGMIYLAEFNGDHLSEADKQQLFQEWLQFGRQMGIRDKDMPATTDEYWAYLDDTIRNRLQVNPATEYVEHRGHYTGQPKHPRTTMTDRQWRIYQYFMGSLTWHLKKGFYPPAYREVFGIRWTWLDQLGFKLIGGVMRMLWPTLEEKKRWVPEAWRAIKDAREHPENYGGAVGEGLAKAS